jgi:hypothetical protein
VTAHLPLPPLPPLPRPASGLRRPAPRNAPATAQASQRPSVRRRTRPSVSRKTDERSIGQAKPLASWKLVTGLDPVTARPFAPGLDRWRLSSRRRNDTANRKRLPRAVCEA